MRSYICQMRGRTKKIADIFGWIRLSLMGWLDTDPGDVSKLEVS